MNFNFTIQETRAVMAVVYAMMCVDGEVHPNEARLLDGFTSVLHMTQFDADEAMRMANNPKSAITILKGMSRDKIEGLAIMLKDMISRDGKVAPNERALWDILDASLNLGDLNL